MGAALVVGMIIGAACARALALSWAPRSKSTPKPATRSPTAKWIELPTAVPIVEHCGEKMEATGSNQYKWKAFCHRCGLRVQGDRAANAERKAAKAPKPCG